MENLAQALNSFVAVMTVWLPLLAGGVVILIIGWIIARLLSTVIGRLATRFNFDGLVNRVGLAQGLKNAGLEQSPSEMLEKFIYWLIMLNVIVVALDVMGLEAAVAPLNAIIAFMPRILGAIIILIAGFLAAEFIGRAVEGLTGSVGIEFNQALGRLTQMVIILLVIILVLQQLGLDVAILNETFVTIVIVAFAGIALAFGLGGRSLAKGVLAGYYARETFEIGDRIIIEEFEGNIDSIGSLNTEIVGESGKMVVPNTYLTEKAVRVVRPTQL